MRKSLTEAESDSRYMDAAAKVIEDEWRQKKPAWEREAELRALLIAGAPGARPSMLVAEAGKAVENLSASILERHAEFLARKPKHLLLNEWKDLAKSQIQLLVAECSTLLGEAVNPGGARNDPDTQRHWFKAWEDKWFPIATRLLQQLDTQTTLKAPMESDSRESPWSLRSIGEMALKSFVEHMVGWILVLLVAAFVAAWKHEAIAKAFAWAWDQLH